MLNEIQPVIFDFAIEDAVLVPIFLQLVTASLPGETGDMRLEVYAGRALINGEYVDIKGSGGVKVGGSMHLHGITHCLDEARKRGVDHSTPIHVTVLSDGFWNALKTDYPKQRENGGRTALGTIPDAYEAAGVCYELAYDGRLTVSRDTPHAGGLKSLKRLASRLALHVHDQSLENNKTCSPKELANFRGTSPI